MALVAGGDDMYGVEQVKVDAIAILYFAQLRHDSIIHVSFLLFLSPNQIHAAELLYTLCDFLRVLHAGNRESCVPSTNQI